MLYTMTVALTVETFDVCHIHHMESVVCPNVQYTTTIFLYTITKALTFEIFYEEHMCVGVFS